MKKSYGVDNVGEFITREVFSKLVDLYSVMHRSRGEDLVSCTGNDLRDSWMLSLSRK